MDILSGLSKDQEIELINSLITAAVTAVSILIGVALTVYQLSKNKRKEIDFKIHEQRKIKYEELLRLIREIFVNSKEINQGKMPIDRSQWLDIQLGMTVYASQRVIKLMIIWMNEARSEKPPAEILLNFGEIILQMRKEVGFNDKNLSIRECLSLFITDIYDQKYDYLFEGRSNRRKKYRLFRK